MIGQKRVIEYIDRTVDNFPSFIVIVGSKGCGKRTVAKYIASRLKASYTPCGIKVDEVREVIQTASLSKEKVVYCFEDADTMRNEAKNAMLKITEEPPRDAYFVMTVSNDGSVLDTIKSRATVIQLQPYSYLELCSYYDSVPEIVGITGLSKDTVCNIATTPHEINMLCGYGQEFIDYVNLVIDNIAEVEPANAFKSSKSLALKSEPERYDLKVFWATFCDLCLQKLPDNPLKYAHGIDVTSPFITKITTRLGINLGQLYDDWVFKIREAWL